VYGYSGQNSSSLYSTTESTANSGGTFALGGNPNLALLGIGGMGGKSWLVPGLIAAAVGVSLLLLLRKRK
jgi:hypothetical protein